MVAKPKKTSDWIRTHIEFVCGMAPSVPYELIKKHVDERLNRAFDLIRARAGRLQGEKLERAFGLIRARVAMGYIRYESNRGRSPCYHEWLVVSLKRYEETKNLDALLDVAFYAIAEFENPSREGTFYQGWREEKEGRDER